MRAQLVILLLFSCSFITGITANVPLVLSTWDYPAAVSAAWAAVNSDGSALDGVESGVNYCELNQCRGSVGYGNHPDEHGETTLDAMIMDGPSHDAGSVACLRNVRRAISVARNVLEHTETTLLAGELATKFARTMGFPIESLSTNASRAHHSEWKKNSCQPNFWRNVSPDPKEHCGPYRPAKIHSSHKHAITGPDNHDTIGMIVIDKDGKIAVGTSTNGLDHKIPGRVGDTPVVGSGGYVDQEVGAAAATGDGDIMMRFVPSYQAVESMRQGLSPQDAANDAIRRIVRKYPKFQGALIATNTTGHFAIACHGWQTFPYTFANPDNHVTIQEITCM
jgi:isoaspartyl peptidase/L-asparaginase-like protein (Ntn-hydrolase superfamily)